MLVSRVFEPRIATGWRFAAPQFRRNQRRYQSVATYVQERQQAHTGNQQENFIKRNTLKVLKSPPVLQTFGGDSVYLHPQNHYLVRKRGIVRNGTTEDHPIPLQWLRDHCHCPKCVHPTTKQRLTETFYDIPADIFPRTIGEDDMGFTISWSDGHESYYTKEWLTAPRHDEKRFLDRQGWIPPVFWTGETVKNAPPTADFADVMQSDEGLRRWLEKIKVYGFCYVENTPITPEDTQQLIERIAYVRNTHYGGFWDFTSDLSKGDTAYTQLGIGPHTDNTYFSDPAGLQLFHLLSHTDGEGGVSGLVDGFAAANELQKRDPGAYLVLANTLVSSHASGNMDSSIQPYCAFPTLVHDKVTQTLVQVRWNTTDRAHVEVSLQDMDVWYNAARIWSNILKEFEYWEQLKPGKALIFDNWRVLHARSPFTGKRRMCGGYVNRDDFISRWKMLNYGRDEILKQVSAG